MVVYQHYSENQVLSERSTKQFLVDFVSTVASVLYQSREKANGNKKVKGEYFKDQNQQVNKKRDRRVTVEKSNMSQFCKFEKLIIT